ncbi:MAG: response regulator [Verrucomicrobiae bacterium]|nr:response regulator [Verrucomicrobiae bacterium]
MKTIDTHEKESRDGNKRLKGKMVLVVNDDPERIASVCRVFGKTGCCVVGVNDAAECLEALKVSRADLVVLDVKAPLTDGWKIFRKIREMPSYSKIPVLFLAGPVEDDKECLYICQKNDQSRFLARPAKCDGLLSMVEDLFDEDSVCMVA